MPFGRPAIIKRMCPSICSGLNRHVTHIADAKQWNIPMDVLSKKFQDEDAHYCSYCGTVWFQGRGPHAIKIGRWLAGVFRAMPTPDTVYIREGRPGEKEGFLIPHTQGIRQQAVSKMTILCQALRTPCQIGDD